jgi:hypothetical protein
MDCSRRDTTGQRSSHKLPRDTIEKAIRSEGFQLWRLRTKKSAPN